MEIAGPFKSVADDKKTAYALNETAESMDVDRYPPLDNVTKKMGQKLHRRGECSNYRINRIPMIKLEGPLWFKLINISWITLLPLGLR